MYYIDKLLYLYTLEFKRFTMKKLYFLFFTLFISIAAFGQLYSEDFSTYTENTGIDGDGNQGDYPTGVTNWTLNIDNATLSATTDWVKVVNEQLSFRDIDGDVIWESQSIDISSATGDVSFSLVGDNNSGGFESSDYFDVYYSVNGGSFILISDWMGLGDTSHTILGEKNMTDWVGPTTVTQGGISGNTLQIRVIANNNAGGEEIFLDNIMVFEGTAPATIEITSPSNNETFAPGTTSVDLEWSTNNLGGSETVNVTVNGSTTMNATSPFPITTMDGQTYNVTVDLIDGGVLDSDMLSFSVGSLQSVADISALRSDVTANGLGRFYEITGSVLVTHTDSFRNRHWIEDSSVSGLLIYDEDGVIPTAYNVGDFVTGLRGTTTESSGILRFVPTSDSGTVMSSGNTVTPQTITLSAFNAAPDDYESELIQLQNVTYSDGDGTATFSTGTNYDITDGSNTVVTRTEFFSADYIGSVIPDTQLTFLVGVAGEFNGTSQLYVRDLTDFRLSTSSIERSAFSIYPNPTSGDFVNIMSTKATPMQVDVYDVLGKKVKNETITNNRLDVSRLRTGVYILRITQGEATSTKKLVIQ